MRQCPCGGHSLFVVHEDGRFSETSHEGCYMARPGQGPPPPAVEADRLGWEDLARPRTPVSLPARLV